MTRQLTSYIATEKDLQRFADKVQFPCDEEYDTACWLWTGARHSQGRGYGKMRLAGRVMNAHKVSYLMFNGQVSEGMVVHHVCENEFCVNPNHLQACSQSENMQICVSHGRHSSQQKGN